MSRSSLLKFSPAVMEIHEKLLSIVEETLFVVGIVPALMFSSPAPDPFRSETPIQGENYLKISRFGFI